MNALGLPRDVATFNSGMLAYAKVAMFDEVVQLAAVSCLWFTSLAEMLCMLCKHAACSTAYKMMGWHHSGNCWGSGGAQVAAINCSCFACLTETLVRFAHIATLKHSTQHTQHCGKSQQHELLTSQTMCCVRNRPMCRCMTQT